jgi:hypothetical protein
MEIKHIGDGKTKETAIYFLNARHRPDEKLFLNNWFEAHDEVDMEEGHEYDSEDTFEGNCQYIKYKTKAGDLWFKLDREDIEDIRDYLKWEEENGM